MPDIDIDQATLPVRLRGGGDSGEDNGAKVDAQGRQHVGLKDAAGEELGTVANPVNIAGDLSSTPGPVQYVEDTADTEVNLDTVTPANNKPLPVDLYDANGQRGTKDNPVKVTDTIESDATSGTIPLTTTPIELKIGASRLAGRKYVWMQALDSNIKWGFLSGDQSFDIFKNQLLCFPVGDAPVYAKMSSGTGNIAFGEGA